MKDADQIPISQSLIKELISYKFGETCGLQFYAKYVDGMLFPSSDVQLLGQWFEFEATGSLPKNQMTPLAERTSKGELTAPYKKMTAQLQNWKRLVEKYKVKILTRGRTITVFDKELVPNPLVGTTDLEVDITDFQTGIRYEDAIGDIKSTGLLDNKWEKYGWEINNLSNKVNLVMQPIHYKMIRAIERNQVGTEQPFFFFLFSNTNETDHRIIKFNIDNNQHIAEHRILIKNTVKELHTQLKKGFKPLPSPERCGKCPVKSTCAHFVDVPLITHFNYEGTV